MSTRNPTIKRILKESAELANHPSADFTAAPLDDDLYEWHFTLRGAPAPSPFAEGVYHGRIVLPPAYPLKPPSFRFLTPTGRFEVNREICLSISGHHEEMWQPAWGVRTALVALRSFMDTDARGQVGGMEAGVEVRRRLATASRAWTCAVCRRSNGEILREQAAAAGATGGEGEVVPEGLRLAYREDLGREAEGSTGLSEKDGEAANPAPAPSQPVPEASVPQAQASPQSQAGPRPAVSQPQQPVRGTQTTQRQRPAQPRGRQIDAVVPPWIDKAIYGVIGALLFLIWKRFIL